MYAVVNIPGSSHFRWFGHATKEECSEWLDEMAERYKKQYQGTWYSCYNPARIISNAEAAKWKWRDGRKVFVQRP